MSITRSTEWHERAQQVIPGGVSSPVRAFRAVGGQPRYFESGSGAYITDVDGNRYLDFVLSWGPMIVGHAHPEVVESVIETVRHSSSFGAPTPVEVQLAEEISARYAPAEKVRFVSSGTEAVMTALRLARAATSRNVIVKFTGNYHGHVDSMLVAAGSGVATLGLPNSPGVTPGQAQDTVVVQYNNYDAVRELFDTRGHEIAAVIVEAVPANAGLILPQGDFNSFLREITEQHGSLFILDEVMTGFRLSVAGWYGLLQPSWTPDLITFGKVIGGGYPLAAVAGRAEVMNQLAPLGSVYQAGTLSGNPVAATAGLVTLKLCTPEVYAALDYAAFGAMQSIKDAFGSVGIPHTLQSVGNLFSVFFTNETVYSFEQAQTQDVPKFNAFFHALLNQGVYIPPSAYEAWFVSSLHDAEAMEFFDQAVRAAAQEIA